ncbi:MAG: hypothetical protein ABW148_09035 [Sedimenticola sp.]
MKRFIINGFALGAMPAMTSMAQAAEGKLTIVTSFPSDLTKVFKAAFEK